MSQARETIGLLGLKFRSIDEVGPNGWPGGRSEDRVSRPKRPLGPSLLYRKEFERRKEQDQRCGVNGHASFRQGQLTSRVQKSSWLSAGKALHMTHHAWTSKPLIASIALALALAPAGKAAEASAKPHLERKTNAAERMALPHGSSEEISGEPQEATAQSAPQLSSAAAPATAKPPQVTYEDGQLTVIAENSALSDVLKALRSALGADIDLPAGVDQHIWVHLGPGPARRVLRDLLDSTEFNYVIQASETDADGILSVLLTQRSKSSGPQTPGLPERAANRVPRTGSDPKEATDSENPARESAASAEPGPAASPAAPAALSAAADASPEAPAASPAAPVNASSASLQYTPGNSASAALSPAPPTDPNQMIQTLQSMYEQRRQMQVQQNQKPAGHN